MSRFQIATKENTEMHISDEQKTVMIDTLNSEYYSVLKDMALYTIEEMKKDDSTYRLITCKTGFDIVINALCSDSVRFCIGYPFAIYETFSKNILFDGFSVSFHIRGTQLRKFQRDNFYKKMAARYENCSIDTVSPDEFIARFRIAIEQFIYDKVVYFDHYHFIGDSVLSTYMLGHLCEVYNITGEQVTIISRNHHHLKTLYRSEDWNSMECIRNTDPGIYIIPDLLDIDDTDVVDICMNGGDGLYALLSRNRFLTKINGSCSIVELSCEDIILTNDNIFDYMGMCVFPFTYSMMNGLLPIKKLTDVKTIFLNPNASSDEKSLSSECLIRIVKSVGERKVIIPEGFDDKSKKRSGIVKDYPNVELIKTDDLSDVVTKLKHYDVDLVITPDTSIAHLSVRHGYVCITVYYEGFWDNSSFQSLSAESPIGFCLPKVNHLPIIIRRDTIDEELIIELLMSLFNHCALPPYIDDGLFSITDKYNGPNKEKMNQIAQRLSITNKWKHLHD